MKHSHDVWYLLTDGTQADPNDVAPDDKGVLRHKSGMAVAIHENGTPMSISKPHRLKAEKESKPAAEETAGAEQPNPEGAAEGADEADTGKQMKPAAGKTYETREAKAD